MPEKDKEEKRNTKARRHKEKREGIIITALIKVGGNGEIVAALHGGKHGKRHRIATFAPQKAAVNTRTATIVTQTRRQQGKMALLRRMRHFRNSDGENTGTKRHLCDTVLPGAEATRLDFQTSPLKGLKRSRKFS